MDLNPRTALCSLSRVYFVLLSLGGLAALMTARPVYAATESSEPAANTSIAESLKDRHHGVEFNFIRLLFWDEDFKSLSGGYSYFDTVRNLELAIPVFVGYGLLDTPYGSVDVDQEEMYSATLDFHVRKFLGDELRGMYLSVFSRAAYLSGIVEESYYTPYLPIREDEWKLGIGIGLGYRVFSRNHFYWGWSINLGTYLLGDSNKYLRASGSVDLDDESDILSVEFFKFGYRF